MIEKIALDAQSKRTYDENGFLHVSISPLTRVQVAPYRGCEIPGWQELGLEPERVYRGYRPASELSKPETIESVNGIRTIYYQTVNLLYDQYIKPIEK